jgi:uncharacterized SAM-binding protein YcdF (DUF218 family)
MIRRSVSALLLVWAFGFVWFAVAMPRPAGAGRADAVVVLTGGNSRIDRGIEVLGKGWAKEMFVSGVNREVRPHEFAKEYGVSAKLMACCVTLGFESVDTRSNAQEIARWAAKEKIRSIRLVTNDWHMRRAAFDLSVALAKDVTVTEDAVTSQPSFRTLLLEYHKLLARRISRIVGA